MAKDYSGSEVSVSLGGQLLTGFAEGEAIKMKYNKPRAILKKGIDGEGGRAKLVDFSAKITLIFLQTSAANDILSAYHKANSKVPYVCKDLNGTTVAIASEAWVETPAEVGFGEEIGNREWVLETDALDMNIGGAN